MKIGDKNKFDDVIAVIKKKLGVRKDAEFNTLLKKNGDTGNVYTWRSQGLIPDAIIMKYLTQEEMKNLFLNDSNSPSLILSIFETFKTLTSESGALHSHNRSLVREGPNDQEYVQQLLSRITELEIENRTLKEAIALLGIRPAAEKESGGAKNSNKHGRHTKERKSSTN